jgi:hypothetical protein
MPISVECQCGKSYNLPDSKAGRRVRCKLCGEAIQVPEPDGTETAETAEASRPAEAVEAPAPAKAAGEGEAAKDTGRSEAPAPRPRPKKPEIEPMPHNPDDLLHDFNKPRLVTALLLTLLIHVVVIGGTSTRYILDTYIDPEGAEARREAAEEAEKEKLRPEDEDEESQADADTATPAPDANTGAAQADATTQRDGDTGKSDWLKDKEALKERIGHTEIGKDMTTMTPTEQIPRDPGREDPGIDDDDDLGLSLDDTNLAE